MRRVTESLRSIDRVRAELLDWEKAENNERHQMSESQPTNGTIARCSKVRVTNTFITCSASDFIHVSQTWQAMRV